MTTIIIVYSLGCLVSMLAWAFVCGKRDYSLRYDLDLMFMNGIVPIVFWPLWVPFYPLYLLGRRYAR